MNKVAFYHTGKAGSEEKIEVKKEGVGDLSFGGMTVETRLGRTISPAFPVVHVKI